MGNKQVKPHQLMQYEPSQTFDLPFLGPVTEMLDTTTHSRHLMKIFTSPDPQSHRNTLHTFKQRKANRHMLQVHKVHQQSLAEFCSNSFKIYVLLDYYEYDLDLLYRQRQKKRQLFSEDELRNILAGCVSALIYFHDNGIKHSYLTRKSIVTLGGQVKLFDEALVGSVGYQHPYYELLMGGGSVNIRDDVFIAPELLTDLRNQNSDPYFSPKSDVYTLGVLLLELAALESMACCFDYEDLTVDQDSIDFKTDRLRYSEQFVQTLKGMIEPNLQERLGLLTLKQTLDFMSKNGSVMTQQNSTLHTDRSRSALLQNQMTCRNRKSVPKLKPLQNFGPNGSSDMEQTKRQTPVTGLSLIRNDTDHRMILQEVQTMHAVNTLSSHSHQALKNQILGFNKSYQKSSANQSTIQNASPSYQNHGLRNQFSKQKTTVVDNTITNRLASPTQETLQHSIQHIKPPQNHHFTSTQQQTLSNQYRTSQSLDDSPIPAPENTQNCSQIIADFYQTNATSNTTTLMMGNYSKIREPDGKYYEGQISKDGKRQGNGILYSLEGRPIYSGSWDKNQFDGFGTFYKLKSIKINGDKFFRPSGPINQQDYDRMEGLLDTWHKYEGEFKRGKIEGFGQLYLEGSVKYNGLFKDGKTDGIGSFHFPDNTVFHGVWNGYSVQTP